MYTKQELSGKEQLAYEAGSVSKICSRETSVAAVSPATCPYWRRLHILFIYVNLTTLSAAATTHKSQHSTVQVKLSLSEPWTYTGGSRGIAPLILNLDTRCRPVPRIISEQQTGKSWIGQGLTGTDTVWSITLAFFPLGVTKTNQNFRHDSGVLSPVLDPRHLQYETRCRLTDRHFPSYLRRVFTQCHIQRVGLEGTYHYTSCPSAVWGCRSLPSPSSVFFFCI